MRAGRRVYRVCCHAQRPCGSPPCRSQRRTSTPPRCCSSTGSSAEVRARRVRRAGSRDATIAETRHCAATSQNLTLSPSLPHSFLLQLGPPRTGGRLQPSVLGARVTAGPDSVSAAGPYRCGACHRGGWLGGPAVLRSGDGRFHLWPWNHR